MGIFHFEEMDEGKSDQFSLTSQKKSKCQKKKKSSKNNKKKLEKTEPVYMPRSKYYSDDETLQQETSSKSSKCLCCKQIQKEERHKKQLEKQEKFEKEQQRKKRHHSIVAETTTPNNNNSSSTTTKSVITKDASNDENVIELYIGQKTASKAAKFLKPCEFRIYYQIPEKSPNIPYKLPLFLAYMSNQNKKVFHFPIVCGKNSRSGENMWSLRYADSATFPSLTALIKYHKTYAYMDPKTGKIDTFPVWKDVIIDEDSFCES